MNNSGDMRLMELADALALGIQEVRSQGRLRDGDVLLNMDYSERAQTAPYVFDMTLGRLHRNGCKAIPESSKATLYAVERMMPGDEELCCEKCRPAREQEEPKEAKETEEAVDIFWGAISFLDQFSAILKERGREYRQSSRGESLLKQFEISLKGIGGRAKEEEASRKPRIRIRVNH